MDCAIDCAIHCYSNTPGKRCQGEISWPARYVLYQQMIQTLPDSLHKLQPCVVWLFVRSVARLLVRGNGSSRLPYENICLPMI